MTKRQLSALFQETLVSEPPLRDLVGQSVERARFERRRLRLVTALGVAAAAFVALVVLPQHGPWNQAMDQPPAELPAPPPLPDRFLPVPGVAADATPRDHKIKIDEQWAAVHEDPYTDTVAEGWTGTTFAAKVQPFLDTSRAADAGLPLGIDGPDVGDLDGTVPSRWVENWLADSSGVTGVWVQQWKLWPQVWKHCTTEDDTCMSSTRSGVTVVSYPTRVPDPVTHKPISSWVARASTKQNLMIVVVAGPRTRAGVSAGRPRTQPLIGRVAVEEIARNTALLGL